MALKVKLECNAQEVGRKLRDRLVALDFDNKINEFLSRLAEEGYKVAQYKLVDNPKYDGINDTIVDIEEDEDKYRVTLKAYGRKVLFIEFGTGITYGYGHPMALETGYAPGSYNPNGTNWMNPKGWYYAKGKHTMGNPPNMGMYLARNVMIAKINSIAKEVFND